jgi:16S rRNA (adenine1518-N6/adenine1519-N6)-dimethyltransferase
MHLPAKKSLGQHFLTSTHVLEQIIAAAHIEKGERVLEIGPGTGILTRALLDAGVKVLAVEKDDRAIELLKEKFAKEIASEDLSVLHDDILEMRKAGEAGILSGAGTDGQRKPESIPASFAVVANIPYYITGAILESFLEHEPRPTRMILLVQREVAERIVARGDHGESEGGKESILSISVKAFGTPKLVARVPRGAFNPPPTVESAILSIEEISDRLFRENNVEIQAFFRILKAGFAHKRKLLKKNLIEVFGEETRAKIDDIWKQNNLDEKIRAEDVPLEMWMKIAILM